MIKRIFIIGTMATGLTLSALHGFPVYTKLAISAHNFSQYFHALQGSSASTNPVERLMFSLMLANTNTFQR